LAQSLHAVSTFSPVNQSSGQAAARSAPPCVVTPTTAEEGAGPWFAEHVQPHEPALRGYLRNSFPSVDADDVVQESYLRLLKARTKGKIASTKAYVFAVARNTAITLFHRRRIYSEVPLEELSDWRVLDGKSDVSDNLNEQLRFELALQAIDSLPPRCREIFRLAALERLSTAEIVLRTRLAENTIYSQIAIGARKCAEFIKDRGEHK